GLLRRAAERVAGLPGECPALRRALHVIPVITTGCGPLREASAVGGGGAIGAPTAASRSGSRTSSPLLLEQDARPLERLARKRRNAERDDSGGCDPADVRAPRRAARARG